MKCFGGNALDLGVETAQQGRRGDADADVLQRGRCQRRAIASRRRIEQREVGNGTRQGAWLIKGIRERHDPIARVAAEARAQPCQSAHRGRDANGSQGVLGEGQGRHSSGNSGAGPATAAARYTRRVIGIANRSEDRVAAGPAVRQLMQIRLTHEDAALGEQRLEYSRIGCRPEVA